MLALLLYELCFERSETSGLLYFELGKKEEYMAVMQRLWTI
jgi:hypothetical protein